MVYKTTSGGVPKVRYGKKFFYKYRLDKLYAALKGVNLATASSGQLEEALAAIDAFFGKIIYFKPRHQPWVKTNKAFCDLDNGVVEVVRRLEYCLRYSQVKTGSSGLPALPAKAEPFQCLISPPMQHKWYSKVPKNGVQAAQRGNLPLKSMQNGTQITFQGYLLHPKSITDGTQKTNQGQVASKQTDEASVNALAQTLGDLELTKESVPFRQESTKNLVSAYHANLGWLFQEMSQACFWFKKSTFEEEMKLVWVDEAN